MKPLFVLIGGFLLSLLILFLVKHNWQWSLAAKIGMSAMLLFTAIGHFTFSNGMQMMLPKIIPFKKGIVWLTGIIEIAAALGLLLPAWHVITGWWLIAFFITILPANISAALRHVNYQNAASSGNGPSYLWFRLPLQMFFIAWVYWFAIYLP